jgi:hypothetical protein
VEHAAALRFFRDDVLAWRLVPTNRIVRLGREALTNSSASRNNFTVLPRSMM